MTPCLQMRGWVQDEVQGRKHPKAASFLEDNFPEDGGVGEGWLWGDSKAPATWIL